MFCLLIYNIKPSSFNSFKLISQEFRENGWVTEPSITRNYLYENYRQNRRTVFNFFFRLSFRLGWFSGRKL